MLADPIAPVPRGSTHLRRVSTDEAAYSSDDAGRGFNDDFATQADRICWTTFLSTVILACGFGFFLVYSSWTTPLGSTVPMHSLDYFLLCMLGGSISGLPHTLLTPIDVIKCRVQVGEYQGIRDGFHHIHNLDGKGHWLQSIPLFFRGWVPTFVGYSMQGALKFGLYECFKYKFSVLFGMVDGSTHGKVWIYLLASCVAELFADVALAPWEAVKIKMQTTKIYPPTVSIVVPRMWAAESWNGFFKGLVPLWARQVPYTMVKFSSFEKIVELIYSVVLRTSKNQISSFSQLLVSMAGGCLAGGLCAIVSHPADTIVSKLNQRTDGVSGVMTFVKGLSCGDMWKGIGLRVVMIGTLTALQWVIYDSFKVMSGLPTTGGSSTSAPSLPLATAAILRILD